MDKKNESNTIYNIVDSVKGGCGKTTFSIMLSLIVDLLRTDLRNNAETSSCLIDMDLQGTALAYLLFGKTGFETDYEKKYGFLNDYIISMGDIEHSPKNYIRSFHFEDFEAKPVRFDVICCTPRMEGKKKFRSMSNQNYSPEVLYSTFRMGLLNMLSQMGAQMPYLHKHIIFDMPPSSDGYSDAIYDVMLKQDYSVMKDGDLCNLFLMQTLDVGQRSATVDYFRELAGLENFSKINKIFFVFNDWLDFKLEDKDKGGPFSEAVQYVKEICRDCGFGEDMYKKIYFLGLNFNQRYYGMCIESDGICNANMPGSITVSDSEAVVSADILHPIKYFASLQKPDIGNADKNKKLIDLMENK